MERLWKADRGLSTVGAASGPPATASSAGQEGQADGPLPVVGVWVEQGDRLPDAERKPAADDGDGERRRGQQRQQVIGPVTGRAVAMAPAVVARQDLVKSDQQVVVAAAAQLHHDQAGGGMWHEDDQQAVTLAGDELGALGRDVERTAPRAGLDAELGPLYGNNPRSQSRNRPTTPGTGADS